jgi:hypothetical protein
MADAHTRAEFRRIFGARLMAVFGSKENLTDDVFQQINAVVDEIFEEAAQQGKDYLFDPPAIVDEIFRRLLARRH